MVNPFQKCLIFLLQAKLLYLFVFTGIDLNVVILRVNFLIQN